MSLKSALDGPSGAGKSTVAKALAARMGIVYVDTGALYRTVGYAAVSRGIDPADVAAVTDLLPSLTVEVRYENGAQHVYLNGENLGDRIRRPEISMAASSVSAIPAVRAFLLETQRAIAEKNDVVMDGRDIGTVILPNADVKIFMTASLQARARRRTEELTAKGISVTPEQVLAEMEQRDAQDSGRAIAPAVPAADAVPLDNSDMSVEENVEAVLRLIEEKTGRHVR